MSALPIKCIEPFQERGILVQCLDCPQIGDLQGIRHGGVGQGQARGSWHRARHIGNAIMQDAVYHKGRLTVRRYASGFNTATLVDRKRRR